MSGSLLARIQVLCTSSLEMLHTYFACMDLGCLYCSCLLIRQSRMHAIANFDVPVRYRAFRLVERARGSGSFTLSPRTIALVV
jgi:hypothetical protein